MTSPEQIAGTMSPSAAELSFSADVSTPTSLDQIFQFNFAAQDFISYEQLREKHLALEVSYNASLKHITNLREQNSHLLQVLKYVDKGMGVKFAELETLKKDNHDLKVHSVMSPQLTVASK